MHVTQSLLRPFRSRAPIILIAVIFSVEICLSNNYVGAMGVPKGQGDAFIRSLSGDEEKELKESGKCIDKKDDEKLTGYCAFEITGRGAEYTPRPGATRTKDSLDVCLKFNGFKSEAENCQKAYCFSLKSSVTFWVLVIGIPIALLIAIGVIIYLCCHFSYYMCCCCIFHMEQPKWFKKAQAKAKVSPEGNAAKGKKDGENATDASKDKGKENETDKNPEKDAEKSKDETKDKEPEKQA